MALVVQNGNMLLGMMEIRKLVQQQKMLVIE